LNNIAEAFGKSNIIVRPYEEGQFIGGSIFSDFLNLFGIEWKNAYKMPSVDPNPRLSRETLEFIRLANKTNDPWDVKLAFISAVKKCLTGNEQQTAFSRQNLLSPAERIRILDTYGASNKLVARHYLGREDEVLFKDPLPSPEDKWTPFAGISPEKSAAIAFELWKWMQPPDKAKKMRGRGRFPSSLTTRFSQTVFALRQRLVR
jgi:hypothetical protein